MIICHTHKFIFIKTRKTAGTSIEGALATLCGPDDIITSDGDPKTQRDFYVTEARNYDGAYNPLREIMLQDSMVGVARSLRDWWKRPKFYNHIGAVSVMAKLDPAVWNSYYKFCFERNPWDKMISFYYFVHRNRIPTLSIDEYILKKPPKATTDQHYCTDWSRYALHDRIIVDDVFDFGDLHGGVSRALARCGVPAETVAALDIPRLKSGTRKAGGALSKPAADRIAEVFSHEIAHFGYRPPEGLVAG